MAHAHSKVERLGLKRFYAYVFGLADGNMIFRVSMRVTVSLEQQN